MTPDIKWEGVDVNGGGGEGALNRNLGVDVDGAGGDGLAPKWKLLSLTITTLEIKVVARAPPWIMWIRHWYLYGANIQSGTAHCALHHIIFVYCPCSFMQHFNPQEVYSTCGASKNYHLCPTIT